MEFATLLKNKGVIAAAAITFILLVLLLKSRGSSAAPGSDGTLYYGTGLTGQQTLELANAEIGAQTQNLQTDASLRANLANIKALQAVNLAGITADANTKQAAIAAGTQQSESTNQTNLSLAGLYFDAEQKLALTQAALEENLASQAAPSPFQRNIAAVNSYAGAASQLIGATSFQGQFGSGAGTGLFSGIGTGIGNLITSYGGGGLGGFGGSGGTGGFGI